MAGWKKIIVSGSSAELLNITASGVVTASAISTQKLIVTGSGEISASSLVLENALAADYGGTGITGSTDAAHFILADGSGGWKAALTSSIDITNLASTTELGLAVATSSDAGHARAAFGLGSIATQANTAVDIDGGALDGTGAGASALKIGSADTTGDYSEGAAHVEVTGSFTGSFRGDGQYLTGVSTVTDLDGLTDVNISGIGSGEILIGSASGFHDLATSGDISITIADGGTAGTARFGLATGSVYSHSLAAGQDLKVGDVTASEVSTSVGFTAGTLDVSGNTTIGGTTTFAQHATFTDPITGSRGAHVQGTLRTYTAADNSTRNIGLHVQEDVSASGFSGEYWEISSSILVTSESTQFGNDPTDVHTFQGDIVTAQTGSTIFTASVYQPPTDSPVYYLTGSNISGSFSQNVDFRGALGGVTGSFFGPLRGITSESLSSRINSVESATTGIVSQTSMDQATQSIADITASISQLDTEMSQATQSITDITASISQLDTEMSQATQSITDITASISQLDTEMSQATQSITDITASISQLDTEMSQATQSITDITASISQLDTEMSQATQSITDITSSIGRIDTALDKLAGGADWTSTNLQDVSENANVTFNNITIDGNLTVTGDSTTEQTIINTTTIAMEDNVIVLNSGSAINEDDATIDAGIQIERNYGRSTNNFDPVAAIGRGLNATLFWDESAGRWGTIMTEASGGKVADDTNAEFGPQHGPAGITGSSIQYLATVSHSLGAPSSHFYGNNGSDTVGTVDKSSTRYGQMYMDTGSGDIWIYGA